MKRIISLVLAVSVMLSLMSFGAFAATENNVLINGRFTWSDGYGLANWSKFTQDTSFEKDTEHYIDGTEAVKITDTSASVAHGLYSQKFSVTPGEPYEFEVMAYIHTGTAKALIRFFDSSSKKIDGGDIAASADKVGVWNKLNAYGIAPAGASQAYFLLYTTSVDISTVTWDAAKVYSYGFAAPTQGDAINSTIIAPNGNTLKYNTYGDKGDTLSDFSYAGFYAGKYEIPDSEYLSEGKYVELEPATYEEAEILNGTAAKADTARINTAISAMSASLTINQMGVVKLKAGKFYVASTSIVLKNNVVLSGSGQGPTGTILYATANSKHNVIKGYSNTSEFTKGTPVSISDSYVKSGSKTFNVSDGSVFKAGDLIRIEHQSTKEWDKYLGQENLTYENNDTSWEGKFTVRTERTVTKVNGNEITVDFPLFVHLDTTVTPCTVYTIDDSTRLVNAGVENLRIESNFDHTIVNGDGFVDEAHASVGVYFQYAKNCYVQDVTFKHIQHSAVTCGEYSKQITIRGCTAIEPVSLKAGSRRYTFANSKNTQQILVNGCYSHAGRHDYETSFWVTGPIAFVDNIADASLTASETHGTWSTGVLYDNLLHIGNGSDGFIATANRGAYGTSTSQGWSGAGVVIWNSLASTIIAHDVPGDYQNFLVGTWGNYTDYLATNKKRSNTSTYKSIYKVDNPSGSGTISATNANFETVSGSSFVGDAYKEAQTTPVEPRSIYKAQLSERFTGSFRNGKPNAPAIVTPSPDENVSGNTVVIKGMYQKGASNVYLYIDNAQYEAELNSANNTFSFSTTLANGTHKIYATQKIDGVEGNKTPDRFVIVKNIGENSEVLSSNYPISTLSLIKDDTRMSYDEYVEAHIVDPLPAVLKNAVTSFAGDATDDAPVSVKNHFGVTQNITTAYRALATKVAPVRGYTVKKYGMTVSADVNSYKLEDAAANVEGKLSLSSNGAYGILFHNLHKYHNYYITPYVIYNETAAEIDHVVYGNTQMVRIGKDTDVVTEREIFFEGFENGKDTQGWTLTGTYDTVEVVNTDKYEGKYSIFINETSTTASGGAMGPKIEAKPGFGYRVEAYSKIPTDNMSVYLRFYDAKGTLLGGKSVKASKLNEWVNLNLTMEAPENTATVCVYLCGLNKGVGSGYFDNIRIIEISPNK